MIYQRKLLGYEQNFFKTRPTKHSRSNRKHREVALVRVSDLTKRKRNAIAKDINSNDEDIGDKITKKTCKKSLNRKNIGFYEMKWSIFD